MKGWRALLLGALCLISTSGADSTDVVALTGANFDDFVKKNPVALVKFMAPWCGHCKKLAPEYEAAAKELKKSGGIPLAEIDATTESELAEKYEVKGFPTIFLFRDGKPEPYSGGRTKDTIIDWLKKMTGPPVEWFDSEKTMMTAAAEVPVAFVGTFKSKTDTAAATFTQVASSNRQKGKFYGAIGSVDSVKVVRKDEGETPASSLDKAGLTKFVETECTPLFGLVSGDNYAIYAARASNWVWVAATKEEADQAGPALRKVAKNYRTEFNFVWLDTDQHKGHAEQSLGLKNYPSIAVVYEEAKYHYPDDFAKLGEKSFVKFLQNIKSGKVEKFFKTEPVPEKNDEPVKVVVGSNFADMVLTKDKDVLLKIYAPWCGHCKRLAPIYDELAEKLEGNDHIMIAKIDGTANEINVPNFGFQGFPTLYFVKAGSDTPLRYDGTKDVDGFITYLKKHSSKPIKINGSGSKKSEGDEDKDEL